MRKKTKCKRKLSKFIPTTSDVAASLSNVISTRTAQIDLGLLEHDTGGETKAEADVMVVDTRLAKRRGFY